ncbi:MAG TPA: ABC transporter ATP-binding protein [Spirochaetia bacterium]|mgnify:FL=1|nr:ABC transporter ATP-binding protein [Spirochaetales bacterium]HRY79149.1 ABC transporter ATP-binding protein [Spirochaetia bacterium]HRZ89927.1 ABC transporter ATP-binding protein [Spirochaetia bacterium]
MSLLELKEIHSYYGNIHALKGVSLTVEEGEIVTLIGANGAGKTTTLRSISGLLHPKSGKVLFNGKDVTHLEAHLIHKEGIGMVPEGRGIFPRLTVLENLEMGAYLVKDKAEIQRGVDRAFSLFPRLKERSSQKGGTLSGGEQQMLATARGLMSNPKILLMDEPSMGLAPVLVDQIFDVIKELNSKGTTILLVEQNALMALSIAHRAYVLQTGSIVLSGTAKEVSQDESVRKAYLGI